MTVSYADNGKLAINFIHRNVHPARVFGCHAVAGIVFELRLGSFGLRKRHTHEAHFVEIVHVKFATQIALSAINQYAGLVCLVLREMNQLGEGRTNASLQTYFRGRLAVDNFLYIAVSHNQTVLREHDHAVDETSVLNGFHHHLLAVDVESKGLKRKRCHFAVKLDADVGTIIHHRGVGELRKRFFQNDAFMAF